MKRLEAIALTLSLLLVGCEQNGSGPGLTELQDSAPGPSGAGLSQEGASGPGLSQGHDSGPSFSEELVPILKRNCVMCHMDGGAQGELILHPQPYAALVGVPSLQVDLLMVAPGDTEASYLYHKLRGSHLEVGGEGDTMPYPNLLADEEIALFEQWIAQGARGG